MPPKKKTPKKANPKGPVKAATFAASLTPDASPRMRMAAKVADALRAQYGEGHALYLGAGRALSEVREVIPSGLSGLDHRVLGLGGFPVGRIVEVVAPPGGGKTTLAWQLAGQAQREGGVVGWGDAEQSISSNRAEVTGAIWDEVILCQPSTLDEGLEQIHTFLDCLGPGVGPNLYVYDSVPALPTRDEIKRGKQLPGELARVLTQRLRKVTRLLAEKRTCLVMINQVRANLDLFKGAGGLKSPGGFFFEHAASVRLQLKPRARVKAGDRVVGRDLEIQATKNRFASPFAEVPARLLFESGWDDRWATVELAKDEGLISAKRRVSPKTYAEALEALGWPAPAVPSRDPAVSEDLTTEDLDEDELEERQDGPEDFDDAD